MSYDPSDPAPQWLRTLAAELIDRVKDRGLMLTAPGAEIILTKRINALAARMCISQRDAGRYFDSAALDELADALVGMFDNEAPTVDLFTLPRTSSLEVSAFGRLVASVAECARFFGVDERIDEDERADRVLEAVDLLSLAGLVQADHQSGNQIAGPPAMFARIQRQLTTVAQLTDDPVLRMTLLKDARCAEAVSTQAYVRTREDHTAQAPPIAGAIENEDEFDGSHIASHLDEYPWVVWRITLRDPDQLAGQHVADRTQTTATAAAELYGCVYQDCVDEVHPDGSTYYHWFVEVKQTEHCTRAGDIPQIMGELHNNLVEVLPKAIDRVDLWTAGPHLYRTYVRNAADGGGL